MNDKVHFRFKDYLSTSGIRVGIRILCLKNKVLSSVLLVFCAGTNEAQFLLLVLTHSALTLQSETVQAPTESFQQLVHLKGLFFFFFFFRYPDYLMPNKV